RSPSSFFADSILTSCFFPAVEMKPRTLCACHSVAFMISARVAPLARPISPRIFAPLLSGRGAVASFVLAGVAATVGTFGALRGFGRALLLAGTLLRGGLLRRDGRALCRNGGGCVGGFVVRFFVVHGCVGYPFLRLLRVL